MSSTWDSFVSGLEQVWNDTATGWKYLYNNGYDGLKDAIMDDPDAYVPTVEQFVALLSETSEALNRLDAMLANLPPEDPFHHTYGQFSSRYDVLASAFFSDTRQADVNGMGFASVMIVLGLAVGVGATSWAVTAYEYAQNLRDQTALASKELDARIEASKAGTVLQPTTLPPAPEISILPGQKNQGSGGKSMMWWSLGGMATLGLLTYGIMKVKP